MVFDETFREDGKEVIVDSGMPKSHVEAVAKGAESPEI